MKVYDLNKNDGERMTEQLSMIAHYQKLIESLRSHFTVIVNEVIGKTDIKETDRDFVIFNLQDGTFSVQRPEESESKKPVPKKD